MFNNTLKKAISGCQTIKVNLGRVYTRRRYSCDVNDLRMKKPSKYSVDGVYVTLYDRPPNNYKSQLKSFCRDSNGVRTNSYKRKDGETQNGCHYVVSIAQQGLTEYGYYLYDQEQKHMENMKHVANWFLNNQDEDTGIWYCDFEYYVHNVSAWLNKHWVSAMGQGQAISFLCRYYLLTKEEKYLEAAKKALQPFHVDVKNGGCVDYMGADAIFEEYPTTPPTHVLNGFIYSLFGLYDYYEVTGDEDVKALFMQGVSSVENILPFYDDSRFSRYDLGYLTARNRKPTQNSKYHLIHVKLLESLVTILDDRFEKTRWDHSFGGSIEFYAKKWRKQ